MRRLASLLGVAALATSAVIISGGTPAHAKDERKGACQGKDGAKGTIPGQPSKVTAVSAQGKTFYLDDRDFDDTADDAGDPALSATPLGSQSDGYTGGTWVYEETGLHTGLQVGATQWVEGSVPGTLPYVPPQKVSVPGAGPVPPRSQTLFPSGIGGGSVADTTGGKDPCWTERDGVRLPPDKDWF